MQARAVIGAVDDVDREPGALVKAEQAQKFLHGRISSPRDAVRSVIQVTTMPTIAFRPLGIRNGAVREALAGPPKIQD